MPKIWVPDYNDLTWPDFSLDGAQLIGIPLSSGQTLTGKFPARITIRQLTRTDPPDFFFVGPMRVVSVRLREALLSLDARCEFFELDAQTIKPSPKFYFCNFLDSIDCFDREHSTYKEETGFALNIKTVALLDTPDPAPVYRITNTIPVLIAVSDTASPLLLTHRFTGFKLVSPQDWINPAALR